MELVATIVPAVVALRQSNRPPFLFLPLVFDLRLFDAPLVSSVERVEDFGLRPILGPAAGGVHQWRGLQHPFCTTDRFGIQQHARLFGRVRRRED